MNPYVTLCTREDGADRTLCKIEQNAWPPEANSVLQKKKKLIRYKHAYTTLLCTSMVPYANRELADQIELAPTKIQSN